jgi:TIR domain
MGDTSPTTNGWIFINYRREDTAYAAGWLYDRLADRFGDGKIFKDIDSIELGDDFAEVITNALASCDVLLALVGDQGLTITDEEGSRRLDDPADFVRMEIEAALARDVRVIPLLVDGRPCRVPMRYRRVSPSWSGARPWSSAHNVSISIPAGSSGYSTEPSPVCEPRLPRRNPRPRFSRLGPNRTRQCSTGIRRQSSYIGAVSIRPPGVDIGVDSAARGRGLPPP